MAALRSGSPVSRALAITLLAVLGGAIWLGPIDPLRTRYLENEDALARGAELLARLRTSAVAGQRASPADEAGALDRFRSDFLVGSEDSIIAADLQTRLGALAAARRAEISSARALPAKSREGLEYLGLRLTIRGEMQGLQHLLYVFEATTPLLFIERATLRLDGRAAAPTDQQGESRAPMTLEIDLYGAKWPSLTPASGAGKPR